MSKIPQPTFSSLAEHWPSTFVARNEVRAFTGGIIDPKYLANLDSQGRGPAGRIRCGGKIAYPVDELVTWLEERSVVL